MAGIDHSIYFQQQAPDFLGNIQKGLSMREMLDQRDLRQKQIAEDDALKQAYKAGVVQNADGTTSFDNARTFSEMIKANPQKAMEFQSHYQQQDAAAQKAKMEKARYDIDMTAQILGGVKDQDSWTQGLAAAQKAGLDVSKMPTVYDQKFTENLLGRAYLAKDKMDHFFKQEDLKVRRSGQDIEREKLLIEKTKAENDRKSKGSSAASELRKERSNLPVTRATQEISSAFNKIQSAAQNPSAAGDLSLIFGYMKMLDPGSTVREGEFANAQNAAGIPSRVLNAYNNALKGERLNPDQRNDFLGQAKGIYQSQMDIQNQVDAQFSSMAEKSGVDPKDVLLNFGANKPAQKTQMPPSQSRPQTVIQNGFTYTLNPSTGEYE